MTATRSSSGPTPGHGSLTRPVIQTLRRDPAVRAIVREHRRLTLEAADAARDHARSTVVACSGGADSVALLIALRTAPIPLVAAHIVHDIRPESDSLADRDHARDIAARLGVRFAESKVSARSRGNLEANARRARYDALARIATDAAHPFIATGHHADDALETLLMRLARGSGPRGLAGPRPVRRIDGAVVVRPMLGVSRADAERICTLAGIAWRHDTTNDDTDLLRNAVRARIVPVLKELSPGVEKRVSRTATLLRGAADLIEEHAESLLPRSAPEHATLLIDRERLRAAPEIVAGEAIRLAVRRVARGLRMDRFGSREIQRVVRAARDRVGGVRTFRLGRATIQVRRDDLTILPMD